MLAIMAAEEYLEKKRQQQVKPHSKRISSMGSQTSSYSGAGEDPNFDRKLDTITARA